LLLRRKHSIAAARQTCVGPSAKIRDEKIKPQAQILWRLEFSKRCSLNRLHFFDLKLCGD
jgi:hypothetical protein